MMYLPTAFLDGAWLWFDRYHYIFDHSPLKRAECRGDDDHVYRGVSRPQLARRAQSRIPGNRAARRNGCPPANAIGLGDRLAELLRVSVPEHPPEKFAPLSWDEVREMARNGIEFGGHTVTHPILQTLSSAEGLAQEIAGCKTRIEEELQAPVRHISPIRAARRKRSLHRRRRRCAGGVRNRGYYTVRSGGPGDDPLWLRRIGVDPGVDFLWFRRCAAAVKGSRQ